MYRGAESVRQHWNVYRSLPMPMIWRSGMPCAMPQKFRISAGDFQRLNPLWHWFWDFRQRSSFCLSASWQKQFLKIRGIWKHLRKTKPRKKLKQDRKISMNLWIKSSAMRNRPKVIFQKCRQTEKIRRQLRHSADSLRKWRWLQILTIWIRTAIRSC